MLWPDRVTKALTALGEHRLLARSVPLLLLYHDRGGFDGLSPATFEAQIDTLRRRCRVASRGDAVAAKLGKIG